MKPTLSLLLRTLLATLTVMTVALPAHGQRGPKPTRKAFINEVLDAKPTRVTARFNDYTAGSYHIDNADLLKGLSEEANKRKLHLRAVCTLGPMDEDPLWTSYVIAFLQEGAKVRANSLVMPHARITRKATGLISADRYNRWIAAVLGSGVLQQKVSGSVGAQASGRTGDSSDSDLLLITWDGDASTRRVFQGNTGEGSHAKKLFEEYNGLLKELMQTYPLEKK